jgi:hypothetical protein
VRLALEVLPSRFLALKREDPQDDYEAFLKLSRLESAHRIVVNMIDDQAKKRLAERFVKILREEDGDTIRIYRDAFFRASDLEHVIEAQRAMIKEHLLSSVPSTHTRSSAVKFAELAPFLSRNDARSWVDPFIRPIALSDSPEADKSAIKRAFIEGVILCTTEIEKVVSRRIDEWISFFEGKEQLAAAQTLKELKDEIESEKLPF